MAPKQTNVEALDEPWLAFRQRHDAELNNLQLQAKRSYEQFQQNVNKAKADLLAKHKKEEEDFWSKAKPASKEENKSGNKSAVSKKIVQGQSNRRVAAAPAPKAAPGAKQTPAAIPRVPQTPTPAYNTTALAYQSRKESGAVTIIDLCSDDDEPVQEQKKPGPLPVTKDPMLASLKSDIVEPVIRRRYATPSGSLKLFDERANQVSLPQAMLPLG